MTGKFTQHVHNLGYYLGHSLHTTIRRAYHDGSTSESVVSNATIFAWLSKHFTPKEAECAAAHTAVTKCNQICLHTLLTAVTSIPQQYKKWWLNLLQTDPLHVLIETLLIVFCIILVILQRRADWRMDNERKRSKLNEVEVEELLAEWKNNRGKLGATRKDHEEEVGNGLIVDGVEGSQLSLSPDSKLLFSDEEGTNKRVVPRSVINFATHDYLSTSSSPTLKTMALTSLEKYGCGSCGPRGFYGTIDAHLEIESCISSFLGTDGAILYSDGASASTSTVAAFAKRGDLLVVDEGVNEALLVGVSLSRANVRYFRHNDVNDLRRVLEKVRHQDVALKRKPTDQRRFLVVEGLYKNWGTMCPLNEIVKLKEEFCYRLILDDSHAMGTMGELGRGSLERCGLKPMQHCEILTFSIENAFGSVGGITVGSEEVVDHQRLSGAGYCFSASAPPFLSKVCVASVKRLEGNLEEIHKDFRTKLKENEYEKLETEISGSQLLNKLRDNISNLYGTLTNSSHPYALKLRNRLVITSHPQSPILYLCLSDQQATGLTRNEQASVLDRIAHHCLVEGEVAVVSTGRHVKKYLQVVPDPCLRVTANTSQTKEDVEKLVKALGEAVEAVLCRNVFGLDIIDED
ncbi:hypothetical protein ACHAWO_002860 [Cyclotella atomus]|uniref:serine C-palmitoyltransferase n=1 Tax=Cyclotella atomus TaxID=382360 RepID=A0ABD3QJK5_9STRA